MLAASMYLSFFACSLFSLKYKKLSKLICDIYLNLVLIQVKDTVQVDQNVSRHLGDELSRDDWNLMVSICFFLNDLNRNIL